MKNKIFLDDLAEKLCNALPSSLQALKKDAEKNFHRVLQSTFAKLELVTREEFDAQTKVLLRTRKKLEALEKKLEALDNNMPRKK